MQTIYQFATQAMNDEIARYLDLVKATSALTNVTHCELATPEVRQLFAAGIDSHIPAACTDPAGFLVTEHKRKAALTFDVEAAVCSGVYRRIREYASSLYDEASRLTSGFTEFDHEIIRGNAFLLPVFQNATRLSKAQLVKRVGSASDTSISKGATEKLAALLVAMDHDAFRKDTVLQRLEITLEGIVRDLVGRVLLEEVVMHALNEEGVAFLREHEYPSVTGVVYDFRADFVLPNHENPVAFIEVRKSSSRHASLYAKDKMFSAINWKGKHKGLIGVVVVEGEWTQAALKIMASVFDYVVPLARTPELAKILRKAQDGDQSVLRWIIDFSIAESPLFGSKPRP